MKNTRWSAAILAALTAAALDERSRAATGRAMTIDDLITAVRVADPQLSPDGRTVVFTRTVTDGKTGKRNADIWTVPADGSAPPREFVGGSSSDTTARFLPDSRQVAFISARDGAPQVYVTDGGSSPRKITDLA